MKQSDIITVILVSGIGILASSLLCNFLLGNPDEKSASFKTIEVVEAELADPDPEVFNSDAINPTVEVYVGNCQDIDANGELDEAELIACGRMEGERKSAEESQAEETLGGEEEFETFESSESEAVENNEEREENGTANP